jgi:metal-sulfur cluster biosynthetic enzyme
MMSESILDISIPQSPSYDDSTLKEWLRPVQDPELHLGLVDLGLIYRVEAKPEGMVSVEMSLTSPGCPAGDYMIGQIKDRLKEHPQVQDVDVKIVWEPKWNPQEMASDDCKEALGLW